MIAWMHIGNAFSNMCVCDEMMHTPSCTTTDPAAEHFKYPVSIDVRDLISLDDAVEELGLGPNGYAMFVHCVMTCRRTHETSYTWNILLLHSGLLYCMEYLEDNLEEWLGEELEVCCSEVVVKCVCANTLHHHHAHLSTPQAYGEDDYLIFDCPGQIELYSHLSVFQTFVKYLMRNGWYVDDVQQ